MGSGGEEVKKTNPQQRNSTTSSEGSITPTGKPGSLTLTRAEVAKHATAGDEWMIIEGRVYDISQWARKHPGGKFISFYSGEDATDAFVAFHPQRAVVNKYLKAICIGDLEEDEKKGSTLIEDFRILRKEAENAGWFKPSRLWFAGVLAHILCFEVLAVLVLYTFGTGWLPWTATVLLMATAQAQTGWLQHDFGHLSTCESIKANHFWHLFTICFVKGASSSWWNARHFRHHAKPNVIKKDPDVNLFAIFVLGRNYAKTWGEKKRKGVFGAYTGQHKYWHLAPALLLPTFFQYDNYRFVFSRGLWTELALMVAFNLRLVAMLAPFLGVWGVVKFYFVMRVVESHWFTWVTQMNHIPMHIDLDGQEDWVNLQTHGTCNVNPGLFNDWFTGHLNYQIEHHFFPTMPRHHYSKVAPLCRSLCEKHGVTYTSKSLPRAFTDVVASLKEYSEIWQRAYDDM